MKQRAIMSVMVALSLTAAVFLSACDEDTVAATGITLSETELTLEVGDEITLTATTEPADATDTVVWTSSDEAVVTVQDGTVKAVGEGEATVTAACGAVSAAAECTVIEKSTPEGGDPDGNDPDGSDPDGGETGTSVRTTVTAEEWGAAFSEENFENFKMTATPIADSSQQACLIGDNGKFALLQGGADSSVYWRELVDGMYLMYSGGEWESSLRNASALPVYPLPEMTWEHCRTLAFDQAHYDVEQGCYIVELYEGEAEGVNDEIFFEDGSLDYILLTQNDVVIRIDFTFGGQSVTLPEINFDWDMDMQELASAFDIEQAETLGLDIYLTVDGTKMEYVNYMKSGDIEYLIHFEEMEGPSSSMIRPHYSATYTTDQGEQVRAFFAQQEDGGWQQISGEVSLYSDSEWASVIEMCKETQFSFDSETLLYEMTSDTVTLQTLVVGGKVWYICLETPEIECSYVFNYYDNRLSLPNEVEEILNGLS